MRRRIILMFSAGIIWLVLVILFCVKHYYSHISPTEFSFYNNAAAAANGIVYITENGQSEGFIYAINSDNEVVNFFDSRSLNSGVVDAIKYSGNNQYGQLAVVIKREVLTGEQLEFAWQIITLDSALKPLYGSDMFRPKAGTVITDIEALSEGFGLAYLERDGSNAYVYKVSYENLRPMAELQGQAAAGRLDFLSGSALQGGDGVNGAANVQPLQILPIYQTYSPRPGHFISDVGLDQTGVRMRLDGDPELSGIGVEETEAVYEIFRNKHLSFRHVLAIHREIVSFGAIAIGIGFIVIFLFVFVIGSRSRNIYTIIVIEILVAVLTSLGIFAFLKESENIRLNASREFSIYTLLSLCDELPDIEDIDYKEEEFYETQRYRDIQKRLSALVNRRGNSDVFYDVFIADTATKEILISASGRNLEPANLRYTSSMIKIIDEVAAGAESAYMDVIVSGYTYRGVAVREKNVFNPRYALVGIVSETYIGDFFEIGRLMYVYVGIVIFMISSILIILFMYLQTLDLRRITKGMQEIATGRLYSEKPRYVMGRDLDTLWNAMFEVDKRVQAISYTKYLIFESYFRFAPKSVELLLGKSSITEVQSGDRSFLDGTMALISTGRDEEQDDVDIKALEIQMDVISMYQDEEKGILVSNDCSLSLMQMLFPKESTDTVGFGTYLMHQLDTRLARESTGSFMLIHYDSFNYGVIGNSSQAAAFIASAQTEELMEKIGWLKSLGTRLLVTNMVMGRENVAGQVRKIGYINLASAEEKIWLYEVLDAEPESVRYVKQATLRDFEEALGLYYNSDFYLAMNLFTDIVKKLPEDGVAKWYLFACERNLENPVANFDKSLGE